MVERRSQDGRVRLVADEPLLDELVARGLLEDRAAASTAGAAPTGFRGRGDSVRIAFGDASVIVKALRRGGLLGTLLGRGFGAQFGDARRVTDALALSQRLLERGVSTTRPAFARVRRGALPGLCRLELATFELPGVQDASTYFAGAPALRERRAAITACGDVVRALHEAGVHHADLNLRNLLIAAGPSPKAWVIDLERSTLPDPLTPRHRVENLARLLRSIEKLGLLGSVFRRADLLRFLAAYESGARRELFLAVARRHASRAPWHRVAWRLFGGRAVPT